MAKFLLRKVGILRHHPPYSIPFRKAIILASKRPVEISRIQNSIESNLPKNVQLIEHQFDQAISYLLNKKKTRDASNFLVASLRVYLNIKSELGVKYGLKHIERLPDERVIRSVVSSLSLSEDSTLIVKLLSMIKPSPWKTRMQSKLPTQSNAVTAADNQQQPKSNRSPKSNIKFKRSENPPTLIGEITNLSHLKIACILDDFSYDCFAHEAKLLQLSVDNYHSELEDYRPDFIFIESAWRGKDGLWGSKVGYTDIELIEILKWAQDNNVPTAFWNKEDPVHYKSFLNTAKLFDYVFTTDMDSIHLYKQALKHNRVFLLPFAFQPKLHNPIEEYERINAVCFAGAYYKKYAERNKNFNDILSAITPELNIDIYDRNFFDDNPDYSFPDEFKTHIVGTLAYDEISLAYKGYNFALNLNTIKNSQTMFARRVFELLASNTTVFSNFSQGIELMFGELVFNSDSGEQILSKYTNLSPLELEKMRLEALRAVFSHHTYSHRLSYIVSKLSDSFSNVSVYGDILVVSFCDNEHDVVQVYEHFSKQTYSRKKLFILSSKEMEHTFKDSQTVFDYQVIFDNPDVKFSTIINLEQHFFEELMGEHSHLSYFDSNSWYGVNFLVDMMHATSYTDQTPITKNKFFIGSGDFCTNNGVSYKFDESINISASLFPKRTIMNKPVIPTLKKWFQQSRSGEPLKHPSFSIDPFNFIEAGFNTLLLDNIEKTNDITIQNQGIDFDEILSISEQIDPASNEQGEEIIPSSEIFMQICDADREGVRVSLENGLTTIESTLSHGKYTYLYWADFTDLDEIGAVDGQANLYLDATPGLRIMLAAIYLDEDKSKIGSELFLANSNMTLTIPEEAVNIRLAIRIYQDGITQIKSIDLYHRDLAPQRVLTKQKVLVISNNYPAYDDRYRNGFLHTRLLEYRKQGTEVDMFVLKSGKPMECREFEGTKVISGSCSVLESILSSSNHEKILIHFLDEEMWSAVGKLHNNREVTVWIHGSEIQPWHRRKFNFENEEQVEKAKIASQARMDFWQPLMKNIPKNLHFVFVSEYFASEVMEDVGVNLNSDSYSIIHNPINTSLFSFEQKPDSQRCKILSIRPFASKKYANDLTVKAIQHLSKSEIFDKLEFMIIGDGRLFEEELKPIMKFENVTIQRKFLSHNEIAHLHKEYGIFVCPTRMDSQGVSRDEAMSSGLVPITTEITAIPEFVDEKSGILTPPEDGIAIADAIERLYHDKQLFQSLSKSASQRVRLQTASEIIITKELQIMHGDDS